MFSRIAYIATIVLGFAAVRAWGADIAITLDPIFSQSNHAIVAGSTQGVRTWEINTNSRRRYSVRAEEGPNLAWFTYDAQVFETATETSLEIRFESDVIGNAGGWMTELLEFDVYGQSHNAYRVDPDSDPGFDPEGYLPRLGRGLLWAQLPTYLECTPATVRTYRVVIARDPRWTLYYDSLNRSDAMSGWQSSLYNASTGSYEFANPSGTVRLASLQPAMAGDWSELRLTRSIPATGNIASLLAQFSWCASTGCATSPTQAMQRAVFRVLDRDGLVIAEGGYSDDWIAAQGSIYAAVPTSWIQSGASSVPASYLANTEVIYAPNQTQAITRAGSFSRTAIGAPSRPAHALQAAFAFWQGTYAPYGPSTFGELRFEGCHAVGLRSCLADLNLDNVVDDADFVEFAAAYSVLLCDDLSLPIGCPADLDDDWVVDDSDFVRFADAYEQLLCD